tara:strand:- start:331 stop:2169 length:1839 start_codon:yes stop_codon:yes gene_type:complete
MNISEIRQKYPQYKDLSDIDLAKGLHSKFYSDIDFNEFSSKIGLIDAPQQSVQDEGVLGDIARFAEPALTMASSIVAEPIAGIAGIAQSLNPYAEPGAGARAVEATREALTFEPKTQSGKEGLQVVGETLAPIGEALSAVEEGLGDSVYDITGSPALAAAATSLPTLAGELLGLGVFNKVTKGTRLLKPNGSPTTGLLKALDKKGLDFDSLTPDAKSSIPEFSGQRFKLKGQNKLEAESVIKKELASGGTSNSLAKFKLNKAGDVVEDLPASEAIASGWSEGIVNPIKQANAPTKANAEKMLKIYRAVRKDDTLASKIRHTDVIGDEVLKRFDFVKDTIKSNGQKLDDIAKSDLVNVKVDARPVFENLRKELKDLDISSLSDFKGSAISVDPTSQKTIKNAIGLLSEGGELSAIRMHKVKRQLDKLIDYNKVSGDGLTPTGESVVKSIRKSLNESIRSVSDSYGKVNDDLSLAFDAKNNFDKSMASLRLDTPSAGSGVGTKLKSLLSNNAGRTKIRDSLDQLNSTTQQLGGKFDSDIDTLLSFGQKIDDMFGTQASTSLGGNLMQASQEAAFGSPVKAAMDAGKEVAKKAFSKSDLQSFEAMRELLRSNPAN